LPVLPALRVYARRFIFVGVATDDNIRSGRRRRGQSVDCAAHGSRRPPGCDIVS